MPSFTTTRISKTKQKQLIEKMRQWFYENYEDPCNNVPYCSEEGGFLFFGRGPYEAQDVLFDQFGETIPEELILELSKELNNECLEWASIDRGEDQEWDDLNYTLNPEYVDIIIDTLTKIRIETNKVNETSKGNLLYALLFVHVISCLETYLYDALKDCLKNPVCTRRFIEHYASFHKQTIQVSALYKTQETINDNVKAVIHKVTFHNLKAVKSLYKAALGKDIPVHDFSIEDAVKKRHCIVHYNCRDKDNNEVIISYADVIALVTNVENLISTLDTFIRECLTEIEIVPV